SVGARADSGEQEGLRREAERCVWRGPVCRCTARRTRFVAARCAASLATLTRSARAVAANAGYVRAGVQLAAPCSKHGAVVREHERDSHRPAQALLLLSESCVLCVSVPPSLFARTFTSGASAGAPCA